METTASLYARRGVGNNDSRRALLLRNGNRTKKPPAGQKKFENSPIRPLPAPFFLVLLPNNARSARPTL
jgi:hypothetical protein